MVIIKCRKRKQNEEGEEMKIGGNEREVGEKGTESGGKENECNWEEIKVREKEIKVRERKWQWGIRKGWNHDRKKVELFALLLYQNKTHYTYSTVYFCGVI